MYLKHAKAWGPRALRRVPIQEKTKVGEYLVADSIEGVVALAQMGVVEIHTWNSTIDDVDRPNRIVWDLDPGPAVSWTRTAGAAKLLHDMLDALGLRSWVKRRVAWACMSSYLSGHRSTGRTASRSRAMSARSWSEPIPGFTRRHSANVAVSGRFCWIT
jgi:hypothetical protein